MQSNKILYSKVTSEPATEPISIAEAKVHLRVDHTDEDSLIDILRQAARETVEQWTGRSLITQTRTVKLDYFPCNDTIKLPYGPVSSAIVSYYDELEVLQTLSSTLYWLDTSSNITRLIVKNSWPATFTMPGAVSIAYVCGYGAATSVPRPIKQAMLLVIGHLYEHREQVGDILHEVPFGVDMLLSPYVLEQNITY